MNAEALTIRGAVNWTMSREDYDREQRVNWSTLKHMAKSPAHYRHALTTEAPDRAVFRIGRVTHLHVYEPERVASQVAVWKGGRPRRGKAWDAFCEKHDGREILTEAEAIGVRAIADAVRNHEGARRYVSGGRGEPTLLWTHSRPTVGGLPGYEIEMKGRPDFITTAGAIVDLKTTTDASADAFGRQVHKYGYHAQAAMYVDGYAAITGVRLPYVLIAVEKTAPHAVAVYLLTDDVLEVGRDLYRGYLDRLAECRATSTWPGYPTEAVLSLPRYAMPPDDDSADGLGLEFNNEGED